MTTPTTTATWSNGRAKTPPQGTFGNLIRRHRERAGMSQLELSRWCCCDPAHISRIERGERQPSREVVSKLAWALGLSDDATARLQVAAGYWPPSWPAHFVDELCGREER